MIVTGNLKPVSLFLSAPIPPQQPQHYAQISHMSNGRGHETEEMSNQPYYDNHDREQYSRTRVPSSAPDNSYRSPYESRESPNVRKLLSLHVMFFLITAPSKLLWNQFCGEMIPNSIHASSPKFMLLSLFISQMGEKGFQTGTALAGSLLDNLLCLHSPLYGIEVCLILVHFIQIVLPLLL